MTAPLDATDRLALPGSPAVRTHPGLLALLVLAVATASAAAAFTAWGGRLSGPAAMQGSARGTAYVLLFAAVPTIAVSTVLLWRGSVRAVVTATGGLVYTVYNAVLLLFLTPYNPYFLLYVAALSTSVWALVALLRATEPLAIALSRSSRLTTRVVPVVMLVVVAFNALGWLRQIVPSITADDPLAVLAGTGVMTNAAWVQDLAIWLPAAAAGAVWLWRRDPRGPLVAGAMLVYWVLEAVSVAVDQWVGSQADPASPVVSVQMVPAFGVLAIVTFAMAVLLLREIDDATPLAPATAPN